MAYMQWEKAVRYDCPHCRSALAWDVGTWRGWVLCPSCGGSTKPPPPRLVLPTSSPSSTQAKPTEPRPKSGDAAGPVSEEGQPRWTRELDEVRRRAVADARTSTIRTVVSVGIASALFVALVGYLDQDTTVASGAATTALVLFVVRMWLGRR